ncbi:MAG: YdcF family protein, partial [Pseudomonadota bacterium]
MARWMIGTIAVVLVALFVGFLLFATTITRAAPRGAVHADGIVVLTGGEFRILEAVKLLAKGRARRLLISGVNRRTSKEQLRRLTGRGDGLFECC